MSHGDDTTIDISDMCTGTPNKIHYHYESIHSAPLSMHPNNTNNSIHRSPVRYTYMFPCVHEVVHDHAYYPYS
jgi:hypothetical protein